MTDEWPYWVVVTEGDMDDPDIPIIETIANSMPGCERKWGLLSDMYYRKNTVLKRIAIEVKP